MIKAIYRAAAPGRLGMCIAVLSIAMLARIGGVIREGDLWVGSESQTMVSIVLLCLVLPVFVSMLATALLRGEHAPWSWGLARPVSRVRLLGSLVALDISTIGACVLISWVVLGGFGGAWGLLGGAPESVSLATVAFLYGNLYLLAATAGSRTDSTVRAVAVAVFCGALLVGSAWWLFMFAVENLMGGVGLHGSWATNYVGYGLVGWGGPTALGEPHTLWLLATLLLVTATAAGPVLAFFNTARLAPGPVELRVVATRIAALVGFAGVLLVPGWALTYARAPAEARTGDITLHVTPAEPVDSLQSAYLLFDGGEVPKSGTVILAESVEGGAARFVGLSPGRYDVCARVEFTTEGASGEPETRKAHYCTPAVLTDDSQQTLTIDLGSNELVARR